VTVKCADFDGSRPLRPGLVMLDLNMPGKDGREALADMKAGPALLGIPVVVLTTSRDEEDVVRSYDLGVSGFIHKPASYAALLEMVTVLGKYWTEVVALPPV
jgi:DNA-binding NarL/FixJ family response regulator